jgi:HD-GYP domain-containing protein (c-di-GMP phosphodiesterase class II)
MSEIIKMADVTEARKERDPISLRSEKRDQPRDVLQKNRKAETGKKDKEKLYEKGITLIQGAFNQIRGDTMVGSRQILPFTKMLVESALVEENGNLSGFYETVVSEDYLPYHSMNVSILSTKVGIWLNLNKSELLELANAAFLHDIGMVKVEDIIRSERRLSFRERRQVNKHPEYGEQALRLTGCLNEDGLAAVRTHHEKGARNRFSQIIGLADVYEAMTHTRSYRDAKPAHEAIEEMIERETFNFRSDIMKTFVNNIGIYPIGSWVKLSTGEVGVVIDVNKDYPLSPKVHVLFSHLGRPLSTGKVIDFAKKYFFYIEGPINQSHKERLRTVCQEGG